MPGIVGPAFNPAAEEFPVAGRQLLAAARRGHLQVGVGGGDPFPERALRRIAGDDGRVTAEIGQCVVAQIEPQTVRAPLAFLFVPRRFAVVLPLLVLGLWAVAFEQIWWGQHGFEQFSRGVLFQGIRAPHRDWIDRALPDGARAGFLWTGRTDRLTVNQNEFFNRGVGPVYYVDQPTPGNLPEARVTIDPRTGAVTLPDGSPVTDGYLLADATFEPAGRAIAFDLGWGIRLWRVSTPLVSATRIDGLYPNETWSGKDVTYVRRRCEPGRLSVELSSDAALFLEAQTVVARSGGKEIGRVRLPAGGQAVLAVPLAPHSGEDECRVVFTVTPTAVPSEVTGGENPDARVLGAHFDRFRFARESGP